MEIDNIINEVKEDHKSRGDVPVKDLIPAKFSRKSPKTSIISDVANLKYLHRISNG